MRRAARFAFVAVLAASALTLTACLPLPFLPQPTHEPEQVSDELQSFYSQTLKWTDCGDGIDCTTMTSPLDWDDPTGDTIEVAVSRHQAKHPIGSLLINPGGPGGSGFDYVQQYVVYIVTPDVLAAYDVVGFDPRGVGQSTPVVCNTDPATQDQLFYGTYAEPYDTQAWVDDMEQRYEPWSQACADNTGALLGHIDAASVAHDMDLLRSLLGDKKINYLGYSYGTYLGTMYAELFPDKVGRMVLDGAVDPQVSDLDALVTQMAGFESAFMAYLDWCLAGTDTEGDCPFSGSRDHAAAAAHDLIGSVDGKGITSSDGRVLDSATVGTAVAEDLYSDSFWPYISATFRGILSGNADPAFAEADQYNGRSADGSYDNGNDVYVAVTCNEGDLGTDGVGTLGGLDKIDQAAPYIGRYIALDDYAVLDTVCSDWPVPVAKLPTTFDAKGAAPIIVIGTSNDPATPYANAVSLSKQLSSGVLISYEGEGHTIYAQGNTCVDGAVDAYLIKGVVPKTDPKC